MFVNVWVGVGVFVGVLVGVGVGHTLDCKHSTQSTNGVIFVKL